MNLYLTLLEISIVDSAALHREKTPTLYDHLNVKLFRLLKRGLRFENLQGFRFQSGPGKQKF